MGFFMEYINIHLISIYKSWYYSSRIICASIEKYLNDVTTCFEVINVNRFTF